MAKLHSLLTANHRPYADVYADAAGRLAATGFVRQFGGGIVAFTADDLYKKVLQLDNASEWILTAITPIWVQVGGSGVTPGAHAASHQNDGSDEISVAGLSGLLADPQTPLTEVVQDIVGAMVVGGTDIDATYDDGAGTLTIDGTAGGGGTPGGSSGDIQYNNGGAFAGAPLVREDADTVGLYDTSNASENPSRLNIYGLKNGATFERLSLYYNTADDRYVLDVNHNGGAARDLQIRMNGTPFWQLEDTGAITAASDTASVMRVGTGTSSAPGLQFSTSPTGNNHGFTFSTGPFVNTITGGAKRLAVHDFGAVIGSGSRFGFSSTSLESGTTEDVALERDAAGRAAIVDASVSHNPRDLKLRACLHAANTFANRPSTPITGMVITVTDSTVNTFGATVAGGGGNTVLAWYNGTNWTVIGI